MDCSSDRNDSVVICVELFLHSDIQPYMYESEYTEELHQQEAQKVFQNYTETNN